MEGFTKYNNDKTLEEMYNVKTNINTRRTTILENTDTVKIPVNIPTYLLKKVPSDTLLDDILKIGNGTFLSGCYLLELIYSDENCSYNRLETSDIDIFTHKDNIAKILKLFEDKNCILYVTGETINIYLEGYHHIIQIIPINVKNTFFITKFHYEMTMMAVYYENNKLQIIIKNGILEDLGYRRTKLSNLSGRPDSNKIQICRALAKLEDKNFTIYCDKKTLNIITDLFDESVNEKSDVLKMYYITVGNIGFQNNIKNNLKNLSEIKKILDNKDGSPYYLFGVSKKDNTTNSSVVSNTEIISNIISNIILRIESGCKYIFEFENTAITEPNY